LIFGAVVGGHRITADVLAAELRHVGAAHSGVEQDGERQAGARAMTVKPHEYVILEISRERERQIEAEGWTPEHDDTHSRGEMARAAAAYAYGSTIGTMSRKWWFPADMWPWSREWLKLSTPRRYLVKAAALIVAEIERIDRAARQAA